MLSVYFYKQLKILVKNKKKITRKQNKLAVYKPKKSLSIERPYGRASKAADWRS